jgi:hypothetical protein
MESMSTELALNEVLLALQSDSSPAIHSRKCTQPIAIVSVETLTLNLQ